MASRARRPTAPALMNAVRAALPPAAATVVVFLPELVRDPSATERAPAVTLIWLGALLLAGPAAAYLTNRRRAGAPDVLHSLITGAPQLPLLVGLMMMDVWLDVQRGHPPANSDKEAVAYGIGGTIASVVGLVLAALVALAARLGSRHSRPSA